MSKEDIMRKIVACLNLGSSPNLNEAQTAILMARNLMAKHKISEGELAGFRFYEDEVVTKETCIMMTYGRKWWVGTLSRVIVEAFSCDLYVHQVKHRSRNHRIVIVGEKRDADVAYEALQSAYVACTHNLLSLKPLSRDEEISYGYGFALGVESAIKQQDEDTSVALVMSTPQNVIDYMDDLELGKDRAVSADVDYGLRNRGYTDGVSHIRKKIEGVNM